MTNQHQQDMDDAQERLRAVEAELEKARGLIQAGVALHQCIEGCPFHREAAAYLAEKPAAVVSPPKEETE